MLDVVATRRVTLDEVRSPAAAVAEIGRRHRGTAIGVLGVVVRGAADERSDLGMLVDDRLHDLVQAADRTAAQVAHGRQEFVLGERGTEGGAVDGDQ